MSYLSSMRIAAKSIDDPQLLDREFPWWRNGKRGMLHSRVTCLRRVAASTQVRLSLRQAMSVPTCRQCFADGPGERDLLDAALTVAEAIVSANEETRAATGLTGRALSTGLYSLRFHREAVQRVAEQGESRLARMCHTATGLLDAASQELGARLVQMRPAATAMCAADLTAGMHGRADENLACQPFLTSDPDWNGASRTGGSVLEDLLVTWQRGRLSGPWAARDAVLRQAQEVRLDSVSQLAGVALPADGPRDALQAVQAAWRGQFTRDVKDHLDHWERCFQQRLARQRMVSAAIHDGHGHDAWWVLRAFDHQGRGARAAGTCPQVVAEWLASRHGAHVHDQVLTAEQMDTALALWDPGSGGAYETFSAAALAAQSL